VGNIASDPQLDLITRLNIRMLLSKINNKTRKVIGYIILIIFSFLLIIGIITLIYMYTTLTNTESLLTLNILLIFALGLLQVGAVLISYKKHIDLVPKSNMIFRVSNTELLRIVSKIQINSLNIIGVILGLLNFILYLRYQDYVERINLIAIGGIFFPILSLIKDINPIFLRYRNKEIQYLNSNDTIEYKLGDEWFKISTDRLRNSKRIDNYLCSQISRTQDILLIKLTDD
jgi:hypothetical protein